jgi:hypothetical protein
MCEEPKALGNTRSLVSFIRLRQIGRLDGVKQTFTRFSAPSWYNAYALIHGFLKYYKSCNTILTMTL